MSKEGTITQFQTKRILLLVIPVLVTGLLWCYARFFPTTNMTGYALQTIFLSAPPYILLLFPFHTIRLFWKSHRYYTLWSFVLWFGVGIPDPGRGVGERSILVANVNAFSGHEKRLQKELLELGDPFVIQIERRIQSIPGLKRIGFDKTNPLLRTSHYSEVYCAESCQADVTEQIGSKSISMPIALLRLDDGICIVGIHAPPPLPIDPTGMKPYLDYLSVYISQGVIAKDWLVCQKEDRVVLMGDLNAVPYSQPYRRLLELGLRDVRSNSGVWGATWPMKDFYSPIPVFRLDQILVGKDILLTGWESVSISNSDHKGLRIWL